MSKSTNFLGFDLVQRHDGSIAVYDYGWWPDEYLDAHPRNNRRWLQATEGWRAKGWIIVHVTTSFTAARKWCEALVRSHKS